MDTSKRKKTEESVFDKTLDLEELEVVTGGAKYTEVQFLRVANYSDEFKNVYKKKYGDDALKRYLKDKFNVEYEVGWWSRKMTCYQIYGKIAGGQRVPISDEDVMYWLQREVGLDA
jgi:hypothetical protein